MYRCIDESIRDASAAFIVTEWKDIQTYPLEKYVQLMREPILFDGRNCYTDEDVKKQKIDYYSVGRKVFVIEKFLLCVKKESTHAYFYMS